MIKTDLTHWPLVITVAKGTMTGSENSAFLADWTRWLGRGEPFVTLRIFADSASLMRPAGGAQEAKAWLQANGLYIRQLVKGMATVVPPAELEETSRMNAEKLFGVPAQCFDTIEKALIWIGSVTPADFPVIDTTAIRADTARLLKN